MVRKGEPVPSLVYLKVFYPDGFRPVGVERAVDGIAGFWISVNDLRGAWDAEVKRRGRGALPAFAITVLTNDSYADLRIITISW